MTLCENCLENTDARPYPVGNERGPQRDPFRIHRVLCEPCREAVENGQWDVVHARYSAERQVTR